MPIVYTQQPGNDFLTGHVDKQPPSPQKKRKEKKKSSLPSGGDAGCCSSAPPPPKKKETKKKKFLHQNYFIFSTICNHSFVLFIRNSIQEVQPRTL